MSMEYSAIRLTLSMTSRLLVASSMFVSFEASNAFFSNSAILVAFCDYVIR